MILFFMLLLFSIIFWLVYRSRKAKNKQLPKVFLIPFFIIAGIFVLSAGAVDTSIGDTDTTDLINKNTELKEQIEEMNDKQTILEKSLEKLENDLTIEQETNSKFEEKIEGLEKEQQKSDEKIEELEKENKELQERVATKKAEEEKIAAEKKDQEARVAEAEKKEAKATATASKKQTEQASPEIATASSDASTHDDCDIKGSQTGIYHVPGSTYYERTKNVAEWFCSQQEAENAGYRAPKR